MRLTKTLKNGEVHTLRTCCAPYYKKLSQYEDIEEELGIDLLTLFKALKDGIYIKKQTQYTYPLALLRTHYSNNTTRYYVYDSGK